MKWEARWSWPEQAVLSSAHLASGLRAPGLAGCRLLLLTHWFSLCSSLATLSAHCTKIMGAYGRAASSVMWSLYLVRYVTDLYQFHLLYVLS